MTSSKELTPTFRKPERYMTATDHILRQIIPPSLQASGLTEIPTDLHKDSKITHETCITKHAKLDFTVTIENEDVWMKVFHI